ncbi:MAG TPA: endolytic transglycosylase MltG [Vicinamibacterales bacterium]
MKKLLALVAVLIVAAGCAAYVVVTRVDQPFRGYSEEAQSVDVPQGAGTRAIGDRLIAAGVVRDRLTYRAALWLSGSARHLKAGEYRFDRPMSARDVLAKIARGDVDLISITFPEGLTIADMAHLFESHGFGPAADFKAAAKDTSAIRELDPIATDLEGYLFPETYALPRHAHAQELVHAMTDRFQKILTPELRAQASARGLTVRQLVTLASIVEKETARPEERPIVAAVYSNRLRLGMGLQCDPTVIYALQKAGRYDGNIRRDDLMFDSPYNTYRYAGLPPGPIAAPGKGSLEAAANPADNDFLYFVSRNDGSHEFARTLSEHNRNVQKFQIQYFRDLRARQHQ